MLTPGWTSYNKRLQDQTYDVTKLLRRGANAIGVTLGNGWYRGSLAWEGNRNLYGDRLGLLAQVEVTYSNGRKRPSPPTRSGGPRPVRSSRPTSYDGETYDARLEMTGGPTPGSTTRLDAR